jgi:hypothetical protein
MIDVDGKLLDSWQELLDGVISVPFCKTVDEDLEGHYVWVYIEGSTGDDTKHSFVSDVVVRTDIVTRFEYEVDKSVANGIDNEIKGLVRPGHGVHGLMAQSGMQILNVKCSNGTGIEEYDSGKKYYRKIVRYTHRIVQTT